jgi:hypothetical protein
MRKYLKNLLIVAVLSFSFVAVALPSNVDALFTSSKDQACKGAALDSGANCGNAGAAAENTVSKAIQDIVNLVTIVVGIAAVIVIIVNGLRFITAAGDSNTINSARTGIIYALVGLVVVAFAQIIVRFVLNRTVS